MQKKIKNFVKKACNYKKYGIKGYRKVKEQRSLLCQNTFCWGVAKW